MSDLDLPEDAGKIIDETLNEALSKRYLAYALSTITARALPDVRDGLKPVHRRILYAMQEMRLNPEAGFKKCARIVGETMGKFHPHGDSAIYDAMVRLAQGFSVRYPLVDGQGNFGNIDGDNPAAYRYTEARLTHAAILLLDGLAEDAVDFRANYDDQDVEPVVLPGGFPNLLANGASGIAVGMATSIPPHNAGELIEACLHLIENPRASAGDLLAFVPAPDFPTGGVIVESKEAIAEAYATGRGGFRMRAKWHVEDVGRGMWRIIVTEIPFQVQKAKLIEQIADLIDQKKAPWLGDIRDESAQDIRVVIEPKSRTVEADALMESLFRQSDLETRFPLNLNVLDGRGRPRVMSLREALLAFLDHRREVVLRRAQHRRAKIVERLEILEGYLKAYLNLDEVIAIIRQEDEPKPPLMKRFGLSDAQAEAILNMRLRALRRLEEIEIKGEHQKLAGEKTKLDKLIASEGLQWAAVGKGLQEARDGLMKDDPGALKRRSLLGAAPDKSDAPLEAFVVREPITVVLSQKGWIRALKGHVDDITGLKFKEGDEAAHAIFAETTDKVLFAASDGRVFTLAGDRLPGGRGQGEPIRLHIDLGEEHEIIAMFVARAGEKRIVASTRGDGFVACVDELVSQKRSGKQVVNLDDACRLAACAPVEGDHVAVIGDNRKLLIFELSELPEMSRGKGVRMQGLKDADLLDVCSFDAVHGLVTVDAAGRNRSFPEWREWVGKRAQSGRAAPSGFPRSGRFRA